MGFFRKFLFWVGFLGFWSFCGLWVFSLFMGFTGWIYLVDESNLVFFVLGLLLFQVCFFAPVAFIVAGGKQITKQEAKKEVVKCIECGSILRESDLFYEYQDPLQSYKCYNCKHKGYVGEDMEKPKMEEIRIKQQAENDALQSQYEAEEEAKDLELHNCNSFGY